MVCSEVEIEPVLQDISGEHLNRGSTKDQDARLNIHARGFWQRHRSAFFDLKVCHPNAVSYRDLEPQQIYRIHENEKKPLYSLLLLLFIIIIIIIITIIFSRTFRRKDIEYCIFIYYLSLIHI